MSSITSPLEIVTVSLELSFLLLFPKLATTGFVPSTCKLAVPSVEVVMVRCLRQFNVKDSAMVQEASNVDDLQLCLKDSCITQQIQMAMLPI